MSRSVTSWPRRYPTASPRGPWHFLSRPSRNSRPGDPGRASPEPSEWLRIPLRNHSGARDPRRHRRLRAESTAPRDGYGRAVAIDNAPLAIIAGTGFYSLATLIDPQVCWVDTAYG